MRRLVVAYPILGGPFDSDLVACKHLSGGTRRSRTMMPHSRGRWGLGGWDQSRWRHLAAIVRNGAPPTQSLPPDSCGEFVVKGDVTQALVFLVPRRQLWVLRGLYLIPCVGMFGRDGAGSWLAAAPHQAARPNIPTQGTRYSPRSTHSCRRGVRDSSPLGPDSRQPPRCERPLQASHHIPCQQAVCSYHLTTTKPDAPAAPLYGVALFAPVPAPAAPPPGKFPATPVVPLF